MNKYYIIPLLLTGILTLTACDDSDRLDVEDINIPRGYALSAGTSTGFYNSSVAYDQAAAWLSGTYASRFNVGDRLYGTASTRLMLHAQSITFSHPASGQRMTLECDSPF